MLSTHFHTHVKGIDLHLSCDRVYSCLRFRWSLPEHMKCPVLVNIDNAQVLLPKLGRKLARIVASIHRMGFEIAFLYWFYDCLMEKCNKYDIYLWILAHYPMKAKQMQRISLNFTRTILELQNCLYTYTYVSVYVCIADVLLSFFLSLKLYVVFHFVHSALSASLSLARRAFHPVPPLAGPLCGLLMCNLICIILHVWRFGYSGVKVKRSMLTEL